MRVVLSDVEEGALEHTTASLRAEGADVHAVAADVSQADDISSLAASALQKYGAVHGLVDTNIFDSERNRPTKFPDSGPRPSGWSIDGARQAFKLGASPRAIGEQVVQAIRDERFYIFTHPEWLKHVEHRAQQIVNGENPTALPPPVERKSR